MRLPHAKPFSGDNDEADKKIEEPTKERSEGEGFEFCKKNFLIQAAHQS